MVSERMVVVLEKKDNVVRTCLLIVFKIMVMVLEKFDMVRKRMVLVSIPA
jgi:hypothetical protein